MRPITRTAQGLSQPVVSAIDSPNPVENNEILTAWWNSLNYNMMSFLYTIHIFNSGMLTCTSAMGEQEILIRNSNDLGLSLELMYTNYNLISS